jgi:hypothetical protein
MSDTSELDHRLHCEQLSTEYLRQRPSVLYRPVLMLDGNAWCALYGENIQEGCVGFGPSPDAAMIAFDAAWFAAIAPKPEAQ